MTFSDWLAKREINDGLRQYRPAYASHVARISDRPLRDMSTLDWLNIHRHADVVAQRTIKKPGTYTLACELAGLDILADALQYDRAIFQREFGWGAWYLEFARTANSLPVIVEHRALLGCPEGDEPFWTLMYAAGTANSDVRWIGQRRDASLYCWKRITAQVPRLLGVTMAKLDAWYATDRAVTATQVERAIYQHSLSRAVLAARDQTIVELDADLDAQFLTKTAAATASTRS